MATHNNDEGKAHRGILYGGDALRPTEKSHSGHPCPQPPLSGVLKVPGSESPNSGRAEIPPLPPKKPPDWVETTDLHSAPSGDGGFVYVMTNESLPDFYKIGMTQKCVENRRKDLSNESIPYPYKVVMSLRVNNAKEAEKQLHKSLDKAGYRIVKGREFFNPSRERLEEMLSKFARKKLPEEKLRLWNPPK